MKLKLVPANRGMQWVRDGLRTFLKRPFSFMGLFGVLLVGMLLAPLLSWLGSLLLWACLPLITLGFMIATRQALDGGTPTMAVFVAPLRGNPQRARALWQLGGLYALAMLLIVVVHTWIDGGRIAELQKVAMSGTPSADAVAPLLADGRLQLSLLWFAGATALLSVPFWHAPALVCWGAQPVAQALFSSTVACWRNKGAFAVYALTGLGAIAGFALVSSVLFALLGLPNMAAMVMMPAVLFFSTVFYTSLYFSFADCFELPAPPATPTAEPTP